MVEDGGGTRGINVRDGERADRLSAIADLVPVVMFVMDGIAALDALKPGVDAFGGYGVLDGGAVRRRENRIEPRKCVVYQSGKEAAASISCVARTAKRLSPVRR